MANPDHLAILQQGLHAWDEWRVENRAIEPDLSGADLTRADLYEFYLGRANLSEANLSKANCTNAQFEGTVLGATNLTETKGLESAVHAGRSVIDIRTLAKSSNLPLSFLRGCGLPDVLIEYLPSLLSQPIQFYSCFISYSTKDQPFAERLHADLQNKVCSGRLEDRGQVP
jgi:uncharacterized protein YjbI with pentapeptide repeats